MTYIVLIDPLSYGVDAMRSLLINASQYNIGIDIGILFVITAIFLWLGSYFFSKIEV
jgi:ABC-2 type transport system permease protein